MSVPIIPNELLADRAPVLHRALINLPDSLLYALHYSVERNEERLAAWQLFDRRSGGGCAIGVMLQELFPAHYEAPNRLKRRRAKRSIWEQDRHIAKKFPRLAHIEIVFDTTVAGLLNHYRDLSPREAAVITGRWMCAEIASERDQRQRRARRELAESLAQHRELVLVG